MQEKLLKDRFWALVLSFRVATTSMVQKYGKRKLDTASKNSNELENVYYIVNKFVSEVKSAFFMGLYSGGLIHGLGFVLREEVGLYSGGLIVNSLRYI